MHRRGNRVEMEEEDEEHRGSLAKGDPQKLVMPKAQLL